MNKMKKLIVSLVFGFVFFGIVNDGFSQSYQIPNGDFEAAFDNVPEPPHWSSFLTFKCDLSFGCSLAQTNKLTRENTGRPGSSGQHSVKIFSNSVVGVVANGTLTTGRIRAGSMTPNNSANYNYTLRSDSNFSCLFPSSATPDSLYIWVKYAPKTSSSQARVSAIIHGNTDFKDPNDASNPSLYRAKAILNFPTTTNSDWELKKIPFVYDGTCTDNTKYILVTLTTNATPGGGTAGEELYVDDIELIYSAWLTDIKMDGQTISGFAPGVFSYDTVYPRGTNPLMPLPTVTYTSEKNDVTITNTLIMGSNNGLDSAKRIIQVKAEDSATIKIYTVNFYIWKSDDATMNSFEYTLNGTPTTITVPAQTPDSATQHIYVPPFSPGTSYIPVISVPNLADTGARATFIQPTSPNAIDTIVVRAENGKIKTYYVHFSVQLSDNANLSSLTYGSTPTSVTDFHKDTLDYNVVLPIGTVVPPLVSVTTEWAGLNPSYTQATSLPGTATVVVTAEDGVTKKTYTVSFTVHLDTNVNLSAINYTYPGSGTKGIVEFHQDTLHYNVELPYGTTQLTSLTGNCVSSKATPTVQIPSQFPGTGTITVTAEDVNYTKTYTIDFTVEKNNVANLSALKYTLNNIDTFSVPSFSPSKVFYAVVLPTGTTATPVLCYELEDTNAGVVLFNPSSPRDTGRITVTAENGVDEKTYTVAFSVALSKDASLQEIKIDTMVLTPFTPSQLTYNVLLDTNLIPTITVLITDANASYKISYPNKIPGQAQIIVLAEDTTVENIYRLNLSLDAPNNPDLIDLSYELNNIVYTIPNFHSDTLVYSVVLPSKTTDIPRLVCQTAAFGADTTIVHPQFPNGAGTITVTSFDENNTKIYEVYFSVDTSTNARLDSLFYNGIAVPNFDSAQVSYTIELPYTTTLPANVSAKAHSSYATVDYYRQPVNITDSAIVFVTAEDNQTKHKYVIHFTRQLSPVATLSALSYTLSGADSAIAGFQPNVFSYPPVLIAPETGAIPQLVFTPTDSNASARLVNPLLRTNGTATVRVIAENQEDSADYTIVFSRIQSSNKRLQSLSYNGILLSNFHPDTLNYTVILPWEETQIPTITASPQWDSTKINIDNPASTFGNASVRVESEKADALQYYNISFKRGSNASLQDLMWSLDGNTYSSVDNFNSNDTGYHVLLPIGTTTLPVLAYTFVDTLSSATVTNTAQVNGVSKVEIMGWDSLNKKTYTVTFEVELSKEAALSNLMIDGITVDNFHTDTLTYFVEYEYGYTTLPVVSATATQPDARIDYVQINGYPGTATITVYAGDTSIQQVYAVSFSIEAGDNAFLSDLSVDSVSLFGFDKNVLSYEIALPYGTVAIPVVTATAEDTRASVSITQIAQFGDTAKIQVVALNGNTNEYQIYFTVDANSNAYAANIFIDGARLEAFRTTSRNYDYVLPADYSGIPLVTVELEDVNATYTVKDAEQIPGQTVIEVTAENKKDKFTYRINFTKRGGGTSVVSVEKHTTISVYPNPSSDNINFVLEGNSGTYNLEIATVEGKTIVRYALLEGVNTIAIDHLPAGMYFYKVYAGREILGTGKFIKQ
ncbi:MAG: T9SS type A sorting domain-containing protein [Bacteroidales bacterium]|jgi:hypothetical protein|nr:T9SS type A sorting domain-containing protein [Bacteroidales bacterium]